MTLVGSASIYLHMRTLLKVLFLYQANVTVPEGNLLLDEPGFRDKTFLWSCGSLYNTMHPPAHLLDMHAYIDEDKHCYCSMILLVYLMIMHVIVTCLDIHG